MESDDNARAILTAIEQRSHGPIRIAELQADTSIHPTTIVKEIRRLISSGYLDAEIRGVMGGSIEASDGATILTRPSVTVRGAQFIGIWPVMDPVAVLTAAFADAIRTAGQDDRTLLTKARDAVAGVSRESAVAIVAAMAAAAAQR